ncbi:hypothetical protein [Chryseobacterium caseinilyticum]|uniref:Lipoprotein n=1 Tax=Chryseobacterium caseinilyticum TaxID=2771428 RepID=A0ABR8ZHM0_9FLAO|nr:hypothetical protein [Chryseobacterium caseinilyticum]MBD8084191.1 hypothetical protein [Chryseobacterium caseinilyticum]
MKVNLFFPLFFIAFGCSKTNTKSISFSSFDITVPVNWNKINLKGTDSDVGAIVTEKNDTVFFDHGPYSNSLDENSVIYEKSFLEIILQKIPDIDTTKMIIVNDLSKINVDDYKLNTSRYEIISGYKAKIVSPKKQGKGMTGIYIDSLGSSSLGKIKFNLYAENLSSANQKDLLKAIRTIKFKK